jgi:hypothetical protein
VISPLGIISGLVTVGQLSAAEGERKDGLEEVLVAESGLARQQYQAIMYARKARREGRVTNAAYWRATAVRAGEQRAPLMEQIRAALREREDVDAALTEATAKLSAPAPEEEQPS